MAAKTLLPSRKRLSSDAASDDDEHDDERADAARAVANEQLAPGSTGSRHEASRSAALPYALLPVTLGRKRRKTSWVWQHFAKSGDDRERNVCLHCLRADPSAATSYPKTTGNSTLAVHLLAKHRIVKGTGAGQLAASAPETPPMLVPIGRSASAAAVVASAAKHASHVLQSPLPLPLKAQSFASITSKNNGSNDSNDSKLQQQEPTSRAGDDLLQPELQDALLDWIVDERLSLDVLESASFRALCSKLNPHVAPPTRDALVSHVEKQLPQALQKFFFAVQEIPGSVALTFDRWATAPGYVALTLHWVSRDWERKQGLLEFKYAPLPSFDSAWCVSELVVSVLRRYNLSTKVRTITTDAGSELESAVAQVRQALLDRQDDDELPIQISSDAWHLRCVSHILQQCVRAALEKIAAPLASLRTVIKYLHDSEPLQRVFASVQQQVGRVELQSVPVLDVENHWRALFAMVDAAYELKDVIAVVVSSDAAAQLRLLLLPTAPTQRISAADWRTLKSVKDFLEQAVAFTVVSESDNDNDAYTSASLLPLIYDSLQAHCKKAIDAGGRAAGAGSSTTSTTTTTTPLAKAAAAAFLDVLLQNKRHLWNDLANLAQILDPRVANASVEAVAMKSEIRRTLVEQYGMAPLSEAAAAAAVAAAATRSAASPMTATKPEKQISSLFAAARQARNEPHPEATTEDEVDAFYKFTASADLACDDVLAWWKVVGAHRFPHVALLARDTLMIPGSALPASAFTGSDRLVSRARAAVNEDAGVETAVKLRAWSRFA